MSWLHLNDNALTGAVPESFVQLEQVVHLRIAGNPDLCACPAFRGGATSVSQIVVSTASDLAEERTDA